jgi:hypothetical protein
MLNRIAVAMCLLVFAAVAADPPKPADETRKFPKAGFVKSEVVPKGIMGKAFLPGGTVAHYKSGKKEYDMFAAKAASPTAAAIGLADYRKALKDPKLIPSFGGYFGDDGGKPTFVFTKGAWVLGVRGLAQKEADLQARVLAGQFQ